MKILTIIVRVLLGLGFVVFGSNAFLQFIPMPPIPQTLAGDFTRVFINSGYASVIGALQLISGLLLLIGRSNALMSSQPVLSPKFVLARK